jgi:aminopeptidase N
VARLDPHSYADTAHPETEALELRATVDFETRTLSAEAVLRLKRPGKGPMDLDTRDLALESIADQAGRPVPFTLSPAEPVLGSRLRLELPEATSAVRLRYRTSPSASALQWLSPAQTFGGREPFLFSQCQAIHARSVVPLQDTPRLRIRYSAALTAPRHLTALMAAAFVSREEQGAVAVTRFEMPQPIPPYLFALAVGDLTSRELGTRSRVWAEPKVAEAAAYEFAKVDEMIRAGEDLFGPYDWDRFDILLMPQSFPYGGMENPRLTFLTPTLLAGDRSLVNVVAHELAHSWTGNLVTSASAEHFWLNEGFTVFAERRIHERLEGAEMCALHQALGRRTLRRAIDQHRERPQLTRLRPDLWGVDPDDAFSQVPYEKGYLLLWTLEEVVGRQAFDAFLRRYLKAFRFQSITADDFTRLLRQELPAALARVDLGEWLDGEGIPPGAPRAHSRRIEAIEAIGNAVPSKEATKGWSPIEWQLYLESVKAPIPIETCEQLETQFGLTASGNYEVLVAWLSLAAESGYAKVLPRIEEVLGQVGRMKYLKPLYRALSGRPETRGTAERCFASFKDRYHPIARQVVESVLRPK